MALPPPGPEACPRRVGDTGDRLAGLCSEPSGDHTLHAMTARLRSVSRVWYGSGVPTAEGRHRQELRQRSLRLDGARQ